MTNKQINKLIDLELLNLNQISVNNTEFIIGANTTLRDIELNNELKNLDGGILVKAIKSIMGVSIRNIATIGGSIMGKYSFSDIITPLLVMECNLEFYKSGIMSLKEFLEKKNFQDILVNVIVKKRDSIRYFYKMQKTRLDFAVMNVAITKAESIDICVGARPGLSFKPNGAIQFINDQKIITNQVIEKTAKIAVDEIKFGSNSRASEEYRTSVVEVYIKRGLKEVTADES